MTQVRRAQLSAMMFLEFFIMGAWWVSLSAYLKRIDFSGDDIGNVYATFSIAAIISPLIMGLLADRWFSAQKLLGFAHLAGGIVLCFACRITSPRAFFWVALLHMVFYVPTFALSSVVVFHQVKDPAREFTPIRVFGSFGWIGAGVLVSYFDLDTTATPILIAGVSSIVAGFFCFLLPDTPPACSAKRIGLGELLGLNAVGLMRSRPFAAFVICSMLLCIPSAFYSTFSNLYLTDLGLENVTGKMTIGQVGEIFFMLTLPFLARRLGFRMILLVGMGSLVFRHLFLAFGGRGAGEIWLYLAIILHGLITVLFLIAGQIYIDQKVPRTLRSSAQGFLTFATMGIGLGLGSKMSGLVVDYFSKEQGGEILYAWRTIWIIPAVLAGMVTIGFAYFSTEDKAVEPEEAAHCVDAGTECERAEL